MSVVTSLLATVGACTVLLVACYFVGSALERIGDEETERAGYPAAEPPLAGAIVFDDDVSPELVEEIAAAMQRRARAMNAERRARLN